jgi:hypothetical protein
MSSAHRALTPRSLAEVALIVSRLTRNNFDGSTIPVTHVLRTLWQSTKSLEQRWTKRLLDWTLAGTFDVDLLAELAPRILIGEMLVRVWGTAIVGADHHQNRDDLLRVAHNAVNSLTRVRNALMSRFLAVPETQSVRVAELDRLRRRCDRWTDVLIGCAAAQSGCYAFAFDENRTRDFSEDSQIQDAAAGPNVFEHFVSAGLCLNFIRHLPTASIDEPELFNLVDSILSCIPETSLRRDGTLRTRLEQRAAGVHSRIDQPTSPLLYPFLRGSDVPN